MREEGDRGGQEDKRRETDPSSNQFPKCSPPFGTHRFTELHGEEKMEEGVRGSLNEMRWNQ